MTHPVLEAALARMEANIDTQAFGGLCVIEGDRKCFCALGVIADEYIKANPGEAKWSYLEDDEGADFVFVSPDRHDRWATFLPLEISNTLGLNGKGASITEWNDNDRLSFPQIARNIHNYMTLFPAGNVEEA